MTILHPITAMKVARLAGRLVGDGSWVDISRVEARDIVRRMEALAVFAPAPASPGARILAAHAMALSALAIAATRIDADASTLGWLLSPVEMDATKRATFIY